MSTLHGVYKAIN